MLAVVLGLVCAAAYGASDFLGGLASRRAHYAVVGVVTQGTALVAVAVALVVSLALGGGQFSVSAVAWGLLSGVGAGVGSVALYRGLAAGRMNVVAPISAAGSALLPVVVGLVLGERPSIVTLVGVALLLPAIALISMSGPLGGGRPLADGAVDGLVAGAGFGLLFVALSQAGQDSGLWPTAASALSSLGFMLVVVLVLRRRGRFEGEGIGRVSGSMAVVAGILGAVATTSFLLSTRVGLLVVVSVLAALYPAVTVLLARLVLKETTSPVQLVGLALAAGGILAIASG